jgi:huntingtin
VPYQGYVCKRCGKEGHYIKYCPTHGDATYVDRRPVPHGIPLSTLRDADPSLPSLAPSLAPKKCATKRKREAFAPRFSTSSRGTANAARVSRGTEVDTWSGLEVKNPKRHATEHITVTVVIYNTVAGGVPSVEDVAAAIDDMEALYTACSGGSDKLSESGFDFMKSELTVHDAQQINLKVTTQPYKPAAMQVTAGDVWPADQDLE